MKPVKPRKLALKIVVTIFFIVILASVIAALVLRHHKNKVFLVDNEILFDETTRTLHVQRETTSILEGHLGLDIPDGRQAASCDTTSVQHTSGQNLCLSWHDYATMRISHIKHSTVQCYNVTWLTTRAGHQLKDCYNLGQDHWYGLSTLPLQTWPLKNVNISNVQFIPGASGQLGWVLDGYWLSSSGVAIIVDPSQRFHISWNDTSDGQMCLISNYIGSESSDSAQHELTYYVCSGQTIKDTYIFSRSMFLPTGPTTIPNRQIITLPSWSMTDAISSQDSVSGVLQRLIEYDFNCSYLELQFPWEKYHGDFTPDASKFPNLPDLLATFENAGCKPIISVSPFSFYKSKTFDIAVKEKRFIQDSTGQATKMVVWQGLEGGVFDLSNSSTAAWFQQLVREAMNSFNTNTVKLAKVNMSQLVGSQFSDSNISPKDFLQLYMTGFEGKVNGVVLESTTSSQDLAQFVSITAKIVSINDKKCLHDIVPQVLTLGLLGYPFLMLGELTDATISNDLLLRWTELSTFLPAMKFPSFPWNYDDKTVEITRNYISLHSVLLVPLIDELLPKIQNGIPIIRPLWWIEPSDLVSLTVDDQFLVGNKLLVAPVLCEGVRERDIYLPPGRWTDPSMDVTIEGGRWLWRYPVPVGKIPYFIADTGSYFN